MNEDSDDSLTNILKEEEQQQLQQVGGHGAQDKAQAMQVNLTITLRIARPRNALWRAILRRAILSMSFIRIARPIYFVFLSLICPSNSPMCCLE